MRIKKQLLFVSLIMLTLPWVGCEYIKEMDSALRKGQSDALEATAKAVAARLGSDAATQKELLALMSPEGSVPVYAHPLTMPPINDGYHGDWLSQNYSLQSIQSRQSSEPIIHYSQFIAGIYEEYLHLFIRVEDEKTTYFNPSNDSPFLNDHIQLFVVSKENERREFVLFTSAPGNLYVSRVIDSTRRIQEHGIKGVWHEWHRGYQVEIKIPYNWADKKLGFSISSRDENTNDWQINNYNTESASIPPLVTRSALLEHTLEYFAREGVKLSLASPSNLFIATAGSLEIDSAGREQHAFLGWLYDTVLQNAYLPQMDQPVKTGKFDTQEIEYGLSGKSARGWYKNGSTHVARVSAPIYELPHFQSTPSTENAEENKNSPSILGVVIADQSADSLSNLTNSAVNRLIIYSIIAFSLAGATLTIYATWLSFRIRKLSAAARNAISESGKVAENFPVFKSQDEIGDLSRSYAQLLNRLKEYTNYLRTLSSKLSHELRTPLAIVRSSLDNLEHEKLSKQAKVYAERAKEGTSRLSNILNSMSAASRVEQAIGAAEFEELPCKQVLTHLKDAYSDVYQHVQFSLNIRGGESKLKVNGSGELLVQMLDKLVDNAADFCPKNGMVELGLYRDNNHVIITVRNEGPPLPKDMQGQLFDSMVSLRNKDSQDHLQDHHLGLGLYIVRLIVDFHRGEVQGYNVPDNSGVIFEVRLPALS